MSDEALAAKRLFTYAEACDLLPVVRGLTEEAIDTLSQVLAGRRPSERAAQAVVARWTEQVVDLGAEVKGLWLVDFDTGWGYYCWRYPERALLYYHTYADGFEGRLSIH